MELNNAIEFVGEQVEELEKQIYQFESIIEPRYQRDKEILERMREQHLKLQALEDKRARGEKISQKDIVESVPEQFR